MPIARIIGSATAKVEWLTKRLWARGYDVQILAPGDHAETPADLEIELENCPLEDAFAHADAFAQSNPQAQILVGPGLIAELAPAAAQADLGPNRPWWRRFFRKASEVSPGLSATENAEPAPQALTSDVPLSLLNSQPSEAAESMATALPAPDPRHEFVAMVADERSRWQSVLRRQEESRQAVLAQRELEEHQRQEQRQAHEAEIARRNREAEAEVLRMASAAEQNAVVPAVSLPESSPASVPALDEAVMLPVPSAATGRVMEPTAIQPQTASEAQEERSSTELITPQVVEPSPLAIPPLPIVAVVPATAVPAPPSQPATAAVTGAHISSTAPSYLPPEIAMMELPIEVPVAPPSKDVRPAAVRRDRRRVPVPGSVRAPRRRKRRSSTLSRRGREWRIAVVAASIFTIVLMGAWSLATNPRPASPFSLRQLQQLNNIQQDLPFGPVRVTNQPSARTVPPGTRTVAPAPASATESSAATNLRSASSEHLPPKPKPSAYRRSRKTAPRRDDDRASDDDVIVRHIVPTRRSNSDVVVRQSLPTPARQPSEPAQAKAGLRHISDLD